MLKIFPTIFVLLCTVALLVYAVKDRSWWPLLVILVIVLGVWKIWGFRAPTLEGPRRR